MKQTLKFNMNSISIPNINEGGEAKLKLRYDKKHVEQLKLAQVNSSGSAEALQSTMAELIKHLSQENSREYHPIIGLLEAVEKQLCDQKTD
jgi:hypothetical protein